MCNVHIACTPSIAQALRPILGSFKTTPTDILYIEASIPPLYLALEARRERAAIPLCDIPAATPGARTRGRPVVEWCRLLYLPATPPPVSARQHQDGDEPLYLHDGERINIRATPPWMDHIHDP